MRLQSIPSILAKAGTHLSELQPLRDGSWLSPGLRNRAVLATILGLVLSGIGTGAAVAQKQGGVLRMPLITSPASMSIHEESTIAALGPMMGVFNNLIMFDQHVKQNSLDSIVPD